MGESGPRPWGGPSRRPGYGFWCKVPFWEMTLNAQFLGGMTSPGESYGESPGESYAAPARVLKSSWPVTQLDKPEEWVEKELRAEELTLAHWSEATAPPARQHCPPLGGMKRSGHVSVVRFWKFYRSSSPPDLFFFA